MPKSILKRPQKTKSTFRALFEGKKDVNLKKATFCLPRLRSERIFTPDGEYNDDDGWQDDFNLLDAYIDMCRLIEEYPVRRICDAIRAGDTQIALCLATLRAVCDILPLLPVTSVIVPPNIPAFQLKYVFASLLRTNIKSLTITVVPESSNDHLIIYLSSQTSLTYLHLQNMAVLPPQLMDAICCSGISTLKLEKFKMNAASITALRSAAKLKHLSLRNDNLDANSGVAVALLIKQADLTSRFVPPFEQRFASSLKIGEAQTTAAKSSTSSQVGGLISLDLMDNELSSGGMSYVSTAIRRNSTLESLNINSNQIKAEDVVVLALSLKINRTLVILDLGNNMCLKPNSAVAGLCQAIVDHATLRRLYLNNTGLSDSVISPIATILQTITHLDLAQNSALTSKSFQQFILPGLLKQEKKLVWLDISTRTWISDQDIILKEKLVDLLTPFTPAMQQTEIASDFRASRSQLEISDDTASNADKVIEDEVLSPQELPPMPLVTSSMSRMQLNEEQLAFKKRSPGAVIVSLPAKSDQLPFNNLSLKQQVQKDHFIKDIEELQAQET